MRRGPFGAAGQGWREAMRTTTVPLPGVTVTRDEHGVPHITARSEADLYRRHGWVHGHDRPLQVFLTGRAG